MVHRLAGWISLPQVISWIPHRNLPCSTLISLLAWNQNSKRKERVTVVHTWPPYLGRSCPFETEEQLTAARKTFDWQPVGSLEAWCHQSATRHLTGSAMMSCCCDWYGSKRAVPTQQDFKAGGSIPPWTHPISSDFKADGICLKGIFSRPSLALQGLSLSFTHQARLGTGLLSSLLSLEAGHPACKTRLRRVPRTGNPWRVLSTLRIPGLNLKWFSYVCPFPLLLSNNKLGIIFFLVIM